MRKNESISSTPIVAIVGRPNVGKSTLFNRIVGKRISIVHKKPGVTLDRIYAKARWAKKDFFIVDTGGLVFDPKNPIEKEVIEQAKAAIYDASLIIFLVERELHPLDKEIADLLRKSGRGVLVAVNKLDNPDSTSSNLAEFYALGIGEPSPISAMHGYGVAELLDKVVENIPSSEEKSATRGIRVAVVGRANVGKSSYINKLLGSKRVIVSPLPGTTRDPVEIYFSHNGTEYILVDTGGIRKTKDEISYYSILRALRSIYSADVVFHMVDASEGFTSQDKKISAIATRAYRGIVIGINKWDLMPKDEGLKKKYEATIKESIPQLLYAPVVFLSALTGYNVLKTLTAIKRVYEAREKRVSTSELNEFLHSILGTKEPPTKRGKAIKFFYATQIECVPPSFVLFMKNARELGSHYRAFLEKKIRAQFGFEGVPIRLFIREKR